MEHLRKVTLHDKRKVFVQRDYTSGLNLKFSAYYPLDISSKVNEETWNKFITDLNHQYECAEKVTVISIFETLLGCSTCYLSRLCTRPTFYKKLDEISDYLDQVNKEIMIPRGLYVQNPVEKGFRVLLRFQMEITLIDEPFQPKLEMFQNVSKLPLLEPRL
uniref:Ras modification protein ERF4 n=1 Tax=Heterorhabditis bacteriophora TaxID=37862 RepID=A0A1I7X8M2_HETBA